MRDVLCDVLSHSEFALFKERKQIATFKIFHDNVEVVLIFKNVIQLDDVGVLANLEHLHLSLEQLLVLDVEVLLLHDFDSDLLATLFVDAKLDDSVFPLAEVVSQLIEIEDVGIANRFFNGIHPSIFFLLLQVIPMVTYLRLQIVNSTFIGEDQHERVKHCSIVTYFFGLILDMNSDQRLHVLVFPIALMFVRYI